ncbi:flippase [Ligilactobacillus pabuli]|uniref:Flippase n=1 Tax=Ligilactobacillus pabuli TaxID=2886039 RepID=A0ABQ5JG62_9LACO|nr:flippase [Ligilactobacillus pabuli]GKS81012.1 flippase [Ligilactobacillus pabuli]
MKVIRNYLYNAGYQILAMILPLITAPYVSRVLTPHGYGLNSFTNSIVFYFVLFGSLGTQLYGNREIAYQRNDREKMARSFWEIQIIKTVGILVALGLYFVFLGFYRDNRVLMIFQSINIIAAAFDISWFFMGIEDFKRTVVRNTLVKVVSLILIFVFIKNPSDLPLYILILGLSVLVGNFTLWAPLKRILVKVSYKDLHPLRHVRPTIALFIPTVAIQIYVVLNKTMLGFLAGTDASGFYMSADNLVKVVLAIVTATGTVMLPHVANAFASGKDKEVNNYLYSSFDFVSFIAVPMAFGLAGIGRHFGPYFYGRGYAPVGLAIMIEAIVIVLIGWSNAVGQQFLLPTKQVKPYTRSVLLGAIVNIVINIPLVSTWGLYGAMLATVLSEATVTGYQLWYIKDTVELKKLFVNFPKYLIAGILMFIPVYLLNVKLWTSVSSLILEVLLGIVIYFVVIWVLKPTILQTAKKFLKK